MSSIKVIQDYKENTSLRNLFFDFTHKALYGADFGKWFLKGMWDDNYHPVSMLKDNEIIATISYSSMDIWLNGKPIKGVQLATVGTLIAHVHFPLPNWFPAC